MFLLLHSSPFISSVVHPVFPPVSLFHHFSPVASSTFCLYCKLFSCFREHGRNKIVKAFIDFLLREQLNFLLLLASPRSAGRRLLRDSFGSLQTALRVSQGTAYSYGTPRILARDHAARGNSRQPTMSAAVAELESYLQSMLALEPPGITGSKVHSITRLCTANVQVRHSPPLPRYLIVEMVETVKMAEMR